MKKYKITRSTQDSRERLGKDIGDTLTHEEVVKYYKFHRSWKDPTKWDGTVEMFNSNLFLQIEEISQEPYIKIDTNIPDGVEFNVFFPDGWPSSHNPFHFENGVLYSKKGVTSVYLGGLSSGNYSFKLLDDKDEAKKKEIDEIRAEMLKLEKRLEAINA